MHLPIFKSDDDNSMLMQTKWASMLNPLLNKPLSTSGILKSIALTTGTNVINHKLGRVQQGWIIADIDGAAQIYRSEPFNDKQLTVVTSAPCIVTLIVF